MVTALLELAVPAVLVLSGVLPAPLLILSVTLPHAVVTSLAALDSAFSAATQRPGARLHRLHALLLAPAAYALLWVAVAMVFFADAAYHWSAWYALLGAVLLAFVRLWRSSHAEGRLFPRGMGPVYAESLAIAAAVACFYLVDLGRAVLPGLLLLALLAASDLVWAARRGAGR